MSTVIRTDLSDATEPKFVPIEELQRMEKRLRIAFTSRRLRKTFNEWIAELDEAVARIESADTDESGYMQP